MREDTISWVDGFTDTAPDASASRIVQIFDPPMCCSTGLCGPTLDQTLLDVNDMLLSLQTGGVSVARYQMTSHPQMFINTPVVMALVRERQMDALPITLVHGQPIKAGAYPTATELRAALDAAVSSKG
jgi:hypothetical protein